MASSRCLTGTGTDKSNESESPWAWAHDDVLLWDVGLEVPVASHREAPHGVCPLLPAIFALGSCDLCFSESCLPVWWVLNFRRCLFVFYRARLFRFISSPSAQGRYFPSHLVFSVFQLSFLDQICFASLTHTTLKPFATKQPQCPVTKRRLKNHIAGSQTSGSSE